MKQRATLWLRRLLALSMVALFAAMPVARAQEPIDPSPAEVDAALGTAITYQGILQDGGQPANGTFDLTFALFNAVTGGTQVGSTLTRENVAVASGRFNTQLDFGNVFGNTALWLQIGVRRGTSTGLFVLLTPRQPMTPAPFSRYAVTASSATNATNATNAQTASNLVLPYIGTVGNPGTIFSLTNSGAGGAFSAVASTSSATAIVRNFGSGNGLTLHGPQANQSTPLYVAQENVTRSAAVFEIFGASNSRSAVQAITRGTGQAVFADVIGNVEASALYARTGSTNVSSYAGYFQGKTHINGTLSKLGGSFKIDHPLNPANKYLQHSFVESPDMMNVYNGNAILDEAGEAIVTLPDYFDALNRDFRYQLTSVGAPAPNLHIASRIGAAGLPNQFTIAGGAPDTEVSWQVTGIREDPWANAHRIEVEVDKPANEQGYYLTPVEHGMAASAGIDSLYAPDYSQTPLQDVGQ